MCPPVGANGTTYIQLAKRYKEPRVQIADQKVVTLDYTLKDDEGTLIDSSEGRGDFVYLHGARNIVPGLENALTGKVAGDAVSVAVGPTEGYGERDDNLQQAVPKEMFEAEADLSVGMQFHAQSPEGEMMVVTVVGVEGDEVVVDGNHPLAGVSLNFDVTVVEVRDASAEEIEHGHVHGPDGHHHDH